MESAVDPPELELAVVAVGSAPGAHNAQRHAAGATQMVHPRIIEAAL